MSASLSTDVRSSAARPARPLYGFFVTGLAAFVMGLTLVLALAGPTSTNDKPGDSLQSMAATNSGATRSIDAPQAIRPKGVDGSRLLILALAAIGIGLVGSRAGRAPTASESKSHQITESDVAAATGLPVIANIYANAENDVGGKGKRVQRKSSSRWMVSVAELMLALAVLASLQSAIMQPSVRELFFKDPFAAYGKVVHDLTGHVQALTNLDRS